MPGDDKGDGKTYMCSENKVKGQQDTETANAWLERGRHETGWCGYEARVGSCFSPRWFESGGLKPLQRYRLQRFGL